MQDWSTQHLTEPAQQLSTHHPQEIPGPLQKYMDHSLVTTYQPRAPQTVRQAVLKGAATTRAATLSADALKHHPLHLPDAGSCACSISSRCANKAQQQYKKVSTGLNHTHRWSVQQHNHPVPRAALTPSVSRSETRGTCYHNMRGKPQLKICRDLHSRYLPGGALTASRSHPSLLLSTF